MAISYVNLTGAVRGIPSEEDGINVESIKIDFENPKDYMVNKDGQRRGFCTGYDPSSTISIKGEVYGTGALGPGTATFATALTIANAYNGFGQTAGAVYLDKATLDLSRTGWKSVDLSGTRLPLITT